MTKEDSTTIRSWISFMSNKVKTSGGINLAQGLPGFRPPEQLLKLLAEEAIGINHQYAPGRGVGSLLLHIAEYLNLTANEAANNILITCGATESITLIYQHLARHQGAEFTVSAFGPTYESYTRLPALLGHRFVEQQWESDGTIDFDKLTSSITAEKIDLLIVGSPGNPWGRVLSAFEIEKLCQLAATSPLRIIFDMVYNELWFNNKVTFPQPLIQENIYITGSFSKLFSVTGWRIGWMVSSANQMSQLGLLHDFTGLSAPHPLQMALSRFMDDKQGVEAYTATLREAIKQSCRKLEQALLMIGFKIANSDGGYFVWAELPDGFTDSAQFVLDLYEQQKVAAVPGIHFGNRFGKFVRFNGARPITEIDESIQRINRFMQANLSIQQPD